MSIITKENNIKLTAEQEIMEDMQAMQDMLATEAMHHFIDNGRSVQDDDARYLIGDKELKSFLVKCKSRIEERKMENKSYTKLEDLRIGEVKELSRPGVKYYEVSRMRLYKRHPEEYFS